MREESWGTQGNLDSPELTGLEKPRSKGSDEDSKVVPLVTTCFSPREHVPGEGVLYWAGVSGKSGTESPTTLWTLWDTVTKSPKGRLTFSQDKPNSLARGLTFKWPLPGVPVGSPPLP